MAMAMEREEDEMNRNSSVFASLMPDILDMTHHFDDSITGQGFQEVDFLLTEVIMEKRTVDGDIIKENPEFMELSKFQAKDIFIERTIDEPMNKGCPRFMKLKDAEDAGILAERSSKKEFDNFVNGKENISPQRNAFSRCERDSRITSIKKPFTVDVRSFGLILNSEEVGGWEKSQDVLAFWEASNKREGGESCESRDINIANSSFPRVGFRRKNSRRTRRLKRFSAEVPFCSEDIRSLDDELLEEECETDSSSFTFISGLEKIHQELNDRNGVHTSPYSSVMQSDEVPVDVRDLNVGAEDYHDIFSHCKLPAMDSYRNYTCINSGDKNTVLTEGEQNESSKQAENIDIFDDEIHVEKKTDDDKNDNKNVDEENDHAIFSHCKLPAMDSNWNYKCTNLEQEKPKCTNKEQKIATPTEGEQTMGSKQPKYMELVQNINVHEDEMPVKDKTDDDDDDNHDKSIAAADKNKIDDTNGLALSSKDVCVETISKGKLESVLNGILDPAVEMSMLLDTCEKMNEAPILEIPLLISNSSPVQEQILDLAEEINSIAPNEMIMNGKGNKTKRSKRQSQKHVVMNWGGNYEGAGTNWNEGVRRSTRIRSRPLEWWRGERFLLDGHKRRQAWST